MTIDNINGISVSEIEKLPVRKVILGDKTYSTRYDQAHNIIYTIDALGQLTGEYKKVAAVNHTADHNAGHHTSQKLNKKELKAALAEEKVSRNTSASSHEKQKKLKDKDKDNTLVFNPVNHTKQHNNFSGSNTTRLFQPGAFILGMALVLIAAVGYFLYTSGGVL